jgi:hypothetical protein
MTVKEKSETKIKELREKLKDPMYLELAVAKIAINLTKEIYDRNNPAQNNQQNYS